MELGWVATKGTAWAVRRSTDLVPSLLGMAFTEWRAGRSTAAGAGQIERELADAPGPVS